jgi:hypothetical protein
MAIPPQVLGKPSGPPCRLLSFLQTPAGTTDRGFAFVCRAVGKIDVDDNIQIVSKSLPFHPIRPQMGIFFRMDITPCGIGSGNSALSRFVY